MVKFIHIADCHIGGWRDEKLKELNLKSFIYVINKCIVEEIDFLIISGDLFNTSLPGIQYLKETVKQLNILKENKIPVYLIPGSHDFSPSGKTMLSILEEANLVENVFKGKIENELLKLDFTTNTKTNTKITGLLGRKGTLEKKDYSELDQESLENEEGFKIFLFHSAIDELKPKNLELMDSMPLSLLPKGFNYYAGGHVHIVKNISLDGYENIIYPGPTFPNNFYELEKLKSGGYYLFDNGKVSFNKIEIINVTSIILDCNDKSSEEVENELLLYDKNVENQIVTIRLYGTLITGKPSDINFKHIFSKLYERKAFFVMKNTYALKNQKFKDIELNQSSSENIENELIQEYAEQNKEIKLTREKEIEFTKQLIKILSEEKNDDEKNENYDHRIVENITSYIHKKIINN